MRSFIFAAAAVLALGAATPAWAPPPILGGGSLDSKWAGDGEAFVHRHCSHGKLCGAICIAKGKVCHVRTALIGAASPQRKESGSGGGGDTPMESHTRSAY